MKLTILAALVSVLVGGANVLHAQEVENLHADEVVNPCILNCPDGSILFSYLVPVGAMTCQEITDTAQLVETGSDFCQSSHDFFSKPDKDCCIVVEELSEHLVEFSYVLDVTSGGTDIPKEMDAEAVPVWFIFLFVLFVIVKLLVCYLRFSMLLVWGGCLTGSSSSRRSVRGGGGGGEEGAMVHSALV